MTIGSAIRLVRTRRGLTQSRLAQAASITPSYLSQVERDKRDPTLSMLKKFSRALGVPLTVLLFLGEEQEELRSMDRDLAERLSYILVQSISSKSDLDGSQGSLI